MLALGFLIGADILKTAIAPTWNEIGQLAAIIALRTIVNFVMTWELKQEAYPVEKKENNPG